MDKQQTIERLLNEGHIGITEASRLAELSEQELRRSYIIPEWNQKAQTLSAYIEGAVCASCRRAVLADPTEHELVEGIYTCGECLSILQDNPDEVEEDDDPQCGACGVYRSEHTLCGCSDGFITADAWRVEREAIRERAFRATDSHLDDYDDYGYDDGY